MTRRDSMDLAGVDPQRLDHAPPRVGIPNLCQQHTSRRGSNHGATGVALHSQQQVGTGSQGKQRKQQPTSIPATSTSHESAAGAGQRRASPLLNPGTFQVKNTRTGGAVMQRQCLHSQTRRGRRTPKTLGNCTNWRRRWRARTNCAAVPSPLTVATADQHTVARQAINRQSTGNQPSSNSHPKVIQQSCTSTAATFISGSRVRSNSRAPPATPPLAAVVLGGEWPLPLVGDEPLTVV